MKVAGRLGYLKGGAEDIVRHAWFAGDFDWDGLVNRTVSPPWKPVTLRSDDVSNFDDEARRECIAAQQAESSLTLTPEEDAEWGSVWEAFMAPARAPGAAAAVPGAGAAGDVGGLVGSSIRAAITAASNGVLDSAESLSEVVFGAAASAGLLGAAAEDPPDSALDIFVKGCKFGVFFWEMGGWGSP